MVSNFNFQTAHRIIFGIDCLHQIALQIKYFGQNVFIISSQSINLTGLLQDELARCEAHYVALSGEPDLNQVTQLSITAREIAPDCIIGIGGGSVIDTAKAVGAFMTNHHSPATYLEVVGESRPLEVEPCPVIALPTTAGTGSEVTKNAVITVPDRRIKVSLRNEKIIPKVAMIDPKLALTLNASNSAATGMDALTQLIESFISKKSNSFTDILCLDGISRVPQALMDVIENGTNIKARCDMAYASLLGGMALANAGLGAVHGFAGVLGGMYSIPHGILCARLLPSVFEQNYQQAKSENTNIFLIEKMNKIASLITKTHGAQVEQGIAWLYKFLEELKIPRLSQLGIIKEEYSDIVEKAKNSSSMKGNPVELSDKAMIRILESSY